ILGRLARALRNPATIAKLRSLSSPDQVRALLLKEDAAARLGNAPELAEHASFKPKLDRTLRLRAIRRLQTQKQAETSMAGRRARHNVGHRRLRRMLADACVPIGPAAGRAHRYVRIDVANVGRRTGRGAPGGRADIARRSREGA